MTLAIITWNVGSMSADLVITLSILWGLWKTRTGWHHSDKVDTDCTGDVQDKAHSIRSLAASSA